jgi:hypothetical protein
VNPADHDAHRAMLALVAATADRDRAGVAAILGTGWPHDERGRLAEDLAWRLVLALRSLGAGDPAALAREVIADTIAAEAEGTTP